MSLRSHLFLLVALASFPARPAAPPVLPVADDLPLPLAREWAEAALAACADRHFQVTALVMGADYCIKLLLRTDGASGMTAELARRKAYTAVKTGLSSAEFGASVAPPAGAAPPPARPGLPIGVPPGPDPDPNLVIWGGGLPLRKAGRLIGAVNIAGAAGPEQDVACAAAGLERIAAQLR